jgi:hypothetical protein
VQPQADQGRHARADARVERVDAVRAPAGRCGPWWGRRCAI